MQTPTTNPESASRSSRGKRDRYKLQVYVPAGFMRRIEAWIERENYTSTSAAIRRTLRLVVDQSERQAGVGEWQDQKLQR